MGFKNRCRRAGIIDPKFHDLRHVYASFFVSSGGDIYVFKSFLHTRLFLPRELVPFLKAMLAHACRISIAETVVDKPQAIFSAPLDVAAP